MALRMKAGTQVSVISAADAKKLGLITSTAKALATNKVGGVADKKPATGKPEEKKVPSNKENLDAADKSKVLDKKANTVATKVKAVAHVVGTAASSKKNKDDEEDPIDKSL